MSDVGLCMFQPAPLAGKCLITSGPPCETSCRSAPARVGPESVIVTLGNAAPFEVAQMAIPNPAVANLGQKRVFRYYAG